MRLSKKRQKWIVLLFLAALAAASVLTIFVYLRKLSVIESASSAQETYNRRYAFVGDLTKPELEPIYRAAYDYARQNGNYVERTGEGMNRTYTVSELLNMAACSGVDGIIVDANDSEEMRDAINDASDTGIPVVCIGTDSYGARRASYVGISYYDLGQEYGRKIASLKTDTVQMVMILLSPNDRTNSQNMVYLGIIDYIRSAGLSGSFSFETYQPGDGSAFSSAEAVTDIISSYSLPPILVCLDETITTAVCQGLSDAGKTGTAVLGYSFNDTISQAIENGTVVETATLSAEQVGPSAVACLDDDIERGSAKSSVPVNLVVLTKDNLKAYEGSADETQN